MIVDLSKHFENIDNSSKVLYDANFIEDDCKVVLMKKLVELGRQSFRRGPKDNRVRGGFSMTGKEALASERGITPVPGIMWDKVISELAVTITKLLVDNNIMGSDCEINYCLYNLYETGKDTIAFHSDSEKNSMPIIASLSLGYPRKFLMLDKHTNDIIEMTLGDGSLLILAGDTNKKYMHCVPPVKNEKNLKRLNLTFRVIIEPKHTAIKKKSAPSVKCEEKGRKSFCDDFWFITPEEALDVVLNGKPCIMFKNWGTVGKITTDENVIRKRLSKIKTNSIDLSDWFILENKISHNELLLKLEKVSVYMKWRYPQIQNKRPNQVKIHTFREIYEDVPEIGQEKKYVVLF